MKRLLRYLLQGILFFVPGFITFYIIYRLIHTVGVWVESTGFSIHPLVDAFIGLIAVVIGLTTLGAIGSSFFFRPIFSWIDELIEKAPLVKVIYTSIKDLVEAFVGQKKKFNKPVLVKISESPTMEKLGFLTASNLEAAQIEPGKVVVYFPASFSLMGELCIVSKENVRFLNANSSELMKFIISGGVTDFSDIKKPQVG